MKTIAIIEEFDYPKVLFEDIPVNSFFEHEDSILYKTTDSSCLSNCVDFNKNYTYIFPKTTPTIPLEVVEPIKLRRTTLQGK